MFQSADRDAQPYPGMVGVGGGDIKEGAAG